MRAPALWTACRPRTLVCAYGHHKKKMKKLAQYGFKSFFLFKNTFINKNNYYLVFLTNVLHGDQFISVHSQDRRYAVAVIFAKAAGH